MIEKLQEPEFRFDVLTAKINEIIDAYNNHVHMSDGSPLTKTPQEES